MINQINNDDIYLDSDEDVLLASDEDDLISDTDDIGSVSLSDNKKVLHVEESHHKERVDKYLTAMLDDYTRSYLQKLISEDRVYVGDKAVKSNFRVEIGQTITLYLPEPIETKIVPENIPIDVIYEDEDIIIINKHKGLVVHPAPGHGSGTLVNALLYHCKGRLSAINGVLRPGIVHRIDKDTTGVLVACKNDKSHHSIAEQLKAHSITRRYQAIVYNKFKEDRGRVESTIGRHPRDRKKMAVNVKNGKYAATNYRLIENLGNKYAYIECQLETGRTHQIRVHMSSIHHPILGDTVYGPVKDPFHLEGQALHAGVLGFNHPRTNEYVEFTAPLPSYFTDLLEKLR
ncbi:MAG: RluA family pseudouridine synthase [Clostridiales bacterium]|nr:RluA family pseudouridine synthase [Clostridiales bacterium]